MFYRAGTTDVMDHTEIPYNRRKQYIIYSVCRIIEQHVGNTHTALYTFCFQIIMQYYKV